MAEMVEVQGIAVSPGVTVGPVYLSQRQFPGVVKGTVTNRAAEVTRLESAFQQADQELNAIQQDLATRMGEQEAAIFAAHRLLLFDPAFFDAARDRVSTEGVSAEWAVHSIGAELAALLTGMADQYLQSRAIDLMDLTDRLQSILAGRQQFGGMKLIQPSILVAADLTPSETARLDRDLVLGLAVDAGGPTSHTAILAKSLAIPAVVGLKDLSVRVAAGELIILDGNSGKAVIRPESVQVRKAQKVMAELRFAREWEMHVSDQPAVTLDGFHVELMGNIGRPQDVDGVLQWGGQGIGLFRTEFLYLERDRLPTEEEQFEAYCQVLQRVGPGRPVTIRTLDVGGDKQADWLGLPVESNPFLGLRGIRYCLNRPDLFRVQLRALLRASVFGQLHIMYPMIQSVSELTSANGLLVSVRNELADQGISVGRPAVGMMVEVPAAAMIADLLAPHVDFFSIGTNDLVQYTLAADRMNEGVASLYQPFHPAVLRLIKRVCTAAEQAGIWAGICGEMAADPVAAPLLLGLGLTEWSMSPPLLPAVRKVLCAVSRAESQRLVASVLNVTDPDLIRERAAKFIGLR